MNKNCLSYWYPKLVGIPTPRTRFLKTDVRLDLLLDGKTPKGYADFLTRLESMIRSIDMEGMAIDFPLFLRTGQGSGKHRWKETCFLTNIADLPKHVTALVEWSALVDMMGLPTDVWVVREMLPVEAICVLPAYHDFPVVKECRAFVKDGEVVCLHPYWPEQSLIEGFPREAGFGLDDKPNRKLPDNFQEIVANAQSFDEEECRFLAACLATLFKDDGSWSVDILHAKNSLYVTDMAIAEQSFHWEDCPNRHLFRSEQ